jgi:hypothetical protein
MVEENPYGGAEEVADPSIYQQDSTNLMNDIEFDFSVSNP